MSLLCSCVCVISIAGRHVDWLWFELGSVCYLCQYRKGVCVANPLLDKQYFLLMKCLHIQCLPAMHACGAETPVPSMPSRHNFMGWLNGSVNMPGSKTDLYVRYFPFTLSEIFLLNSLSQSVTHYCITLLA